MNLKVKYEPESLTEVSDEGLCVLHSAIMFISKLLAEKGALDQPGLCGALTQTMGDKNYLALTSPITQLFRTWDKFSGSHHYPVRTKELTGVQAYCSERTSRDRWSPTNEYGANRRDLLLHMINEVSKEVVSRSLVCDPNDHELKYLWDWE